MKPTSVTFRNSPVRRDHLLNHSNAPHHPHPSWGPIAGPKPPPLFSTDWFEAWMSRLHREFGKRSTFQIVIIAILFHSALSIFLIYAHLVYYSETYLSKHSAVHSHPNRGKIAVTSRQPLTIEDVDSELRFKVRNGHHGFLDPGNETLFGPAASANLLSTKLIDARELTYIGWFSDHYRWEADRHQCWPMASNEAGGRWTLCDKIFSARCNPDAIRAIYQFVPLKKSANIRQLFFSIRATAEALTEQYAAPGANNNPTAEPFYGLMALVEFSAKEDEPELLKLKFQYENDAWSLRTLHYDSTKGKKSSPISAVTLMVACFGYSGVASFADIRLTSASVGIDPLYSHHEVGAWCDYLLKPLPPPSQPSEILNQPPPQINLLPHELLPLPKTTNKQQQQSSFSSSHHLVTFVSQLSIDRLPILERSLQTWTGPVSLAIYIPLKGSSTQGDLRDQESASTILDWQRLYINKKIAALGGNISLGESTVALVPGTEGAVYPINALRNLAMSGVRTRFAFLVDADFQPSPGLEAHFAAYLQRKELGKKVGKEEEVEKVAYVVPAFEYLETPNRDDPIIKSKDELIQLVHREEPIVQPFRFFESNEAHCLTNYWKWYYASEPYTLATQFHDKYEPYVIVEKTAHLPPPYAELLVNYGMNKVMHASELFAAGYAFTVLDAVWAIHTPHRATAYYADFLTNLEARLRNRAARFHVLADILERYRVPLAECERLPR